MQSVSAKLPKCIVVSGMTGCGKSDVTRRLAARHNGVIVCGDSVQLNRGLDILTNKNKDVLLTSKYLVEARKYSSKLHSFGIEIHKKFLFRKVFQKIVKTNHSFIILFLDLTKASSPKVALPFTS